MSAKLAPASIRRLPDVLANQIAAGEVIERPASVVKELVENSLDAQAARVEVALENGGMNRIEVIDDGTGIAHQELPLAVAAHATSKLDGSDSLMRIATLGFRGEALASICAVSRWCLTSCEPGAQTAWQLCHDQQRLQPAALPHGTRMSVAQLFYNVPARRKFLRTEQTEYRHVDNVFRRLALSHFEVGFTLRHNGRVAHKLSPARDHGARERRVRKLCGKAFVDNARWLELDWQAMRLRGWLGQADYSRPQGDVQYFFINGRMVRDRIINHAIRQAYQARLYPGRFPAYVLYLELPYEEVDVNVHPTKHEVRFRQARQVHDFLSRALREALYPDPQDQLLSRLPAYRDAYHRPAPGPARAAAAAETPEPYAVQTRAQPVSDTAPYGRCLQILFARFALFADAQDYWLMDLRRAQRCVTDHRLREGLRRGSLTTRPLLIPRALRASAPQLQAMEAYSARLQGLGFDCSECGPSSLLLRSIPAALPADLDANSLIPALLEAIARRGTDDDAIIGMLSRHVAEHGAAYDCEDAQRLCTELAAHELDMSALVQPLREEDLERLVQGTGD